MKKCINCKNNVKDEDKYCRNCGCKINSSFKYALTNLLIIIIALGVLFMIALFVASYIIENQ